MPSTVTERNALLEVSIGNLGLLQRAGHISPFLAGPLVVALVQADDEQNMARMRWIAGEVERVRRMFAGLESAEGLTPEAGTMGRMFAIATLRSILTSADAG
jgi:hypothetical protein